MATTKDIGRLVGRAGATGGSRTYRQQRPLRWYGSLLLIVLLGVFLVWYSRWQQENPPTASHPTTSDHWVAGVAFDICGTDEPNLAANPNATSSPGLSTQGNGVIQIQPHDGSESGSNATLGKFASEYPGLTLTDTSIKLPGTKSSTVGALFVDGDKCPSGTPDAGKVGNMSVAEWPSFSTSPNKYVHISDPVHLRLGQAQIIQVEFVPSGTAPNKPAALVTAVLNAVTALNSPTSTTTPTPASTVPITATTVSSVTSTSRASTATTKPVATTSSPTTTKASTSTTAKS